MYMCDPAIAHEGDRYREKEKENKSERAGSLLVDLLTKINSRD